MIDSRAVKLRLKRKQGSEVALAQAIYNSIVWFTASEERGKVNKRKRVAMRKHRIRLKKFEERRKALVSAAVPQAPPVPRPLAQAPAPVAVEAPKRTPRRAAEPKAPKEPVEPKAAKEPAAPKEVAQPKATKEPAEPKAIEEPKQPKATKATKATKEPKQPKEPKAAK